MSKIFTRSTHATPTIADLVMVRCAGGCGLSVPVKQSVCRACVVDLMEWRRTYDGPAPLTDDEEVKLLAVLQRVMADPKAV